MKIKRIHEGNVHYSGLVRLGGDSGASVGRMGKMDSGFKATIGGVSSVVRQVYTQKIQTISCYLLITIVDKFRRNKLHPSIHLCAYSNQDG